MNTSEKWKDRSFFAEIKIVEHTWHLSFEFYCFVYPSQCRRLYSSFEFVRKRQQHPVVQNQTIIVNILSCFVDMTEWNGLPLRDTLWLDLKVRGTPKFCYKFLVCTITPPYIHEVDEHDMIFIVLSVDDDE